MMRLINESDLVAANARTLVIGQHGRAAAIDKDLAMIGMLKQPRDVQKGRFA